MKNFKVFEILFTIALTYFFFLSVILASTGKKAKLLHNCYIIRNAIDFKINAARIVVF